MKNSLYDIFAEKWGSNIYIYSDPHFGDLNSYKFRFPDRYELALLNAKQLNDTQEEVDRVFVKILNQMQIDNINKKCGKASTLIILGDVGDIECVKKLKARYKVLVLGNHDKGASNYKRGFEAHHVIADEEFKRTDFRYDSLSKNGYCLKFEHYQGENGIGEYWEKIEDNHLFDEVYEGTLQIGPKLILSHEPVDSKYCLNIHGHVHPGNNQDEWRFGYYLESTELGLQYKVNAIAEALNYEPISLSKIIKAGCLSDIKDIHREHIGRKE